jgi:sugar O-acyltransferase (sialic acid O-acetyltransferase NeuD family)
MRKKAIIGYGGFAREVAVQMKFDDIRYFVDDQYWIDNESNVYKLSEFDPERYEVIVAIGNSSLRNDVISRLPRSTKYFTAVHESVQIIGNSVEIGEGSIICAGTIISINSRLGKHTHLNLNTTIGHDCKIDDFFTTGPGVNISGNNVYGKRVYIGTGSCTREKISICDDVTVGMHSGVIKSITESGVYIGTPSAKL